MDRIQPWAWTEAAGQWNSLAIHRVITGVQQALFGPEIDGASVFRPHLSAVLDKSGFTQTASGHGLEILEHLRCPGGSGEDQVDVIRSAVARAQNPSPE